LGKLAKLRHEFQELGTTAEWEEAVDEALERFLEEMGSKWIGK